MSSIDFVDWFELICSNFCRYHLKAWQVAATLVTSQSTMFPWYLDLAPQVSFFLAESLEPTRDK